MLFFLISLLLTPAPSTTLSEQLVRETTASVLAKHKTDGVFIIYDEQQQRFLRSGGERSRAGFVPASTFKVPNSLIALAEGVVADEREVFVWDGVERQIASWNQDQTLESAMRVSAVWTYQHIAREVGRERMQMHLNELGYGNATIGDEVDTFWLDGSLLISPQEQIHFLRRLHHNQLPFRQDHMDIVKRILIRGEAGHRVLRGKTGWEVRTGNDQGWFVGYVTDESKVWFFALHVDIYADGPGKDREGIAKEILAGLSLW
ncbi:MAG: class D beta-lactamase [Pseudomonadota bacterium]